MKPVIFVLLAGICVVAVIEYDDRWVDEKMSSNPCQLEHRQWSLDRAEMWSGHTVTGLPCQTWIAADR